MYFSHVKTIEHLLQTYQHNQPLHLYLKSFFRSQKKFGARDRKIITTYLYNYYRVANALKDLSFDKILNVLEIIYENPTSQPDEIIASIKKVYPSFDLKNIFPFTDELSHGIYADLFCKSILQRPKVFIRIRKGYEIPVKEEFEKTGFDFQIINPNIFSFESESKLSETNSFKDGLFEIQDLSSQQTSDYFDAKPGDHWWDCCAGSGGKSLLFKDKFPDIQLTISDVRESILKNAEERLKKSGIKNVELKNIDMLSPPNEQHLYDGIIVDAPCSGSGTWARTPEEISFFTNDKIYLYSETQIEIVTNACKSLKPGAQLIYITCSVLKKENEEITKQIVDHSPLRLMKSSIINGYKRQSDSMYAAKFIKS